MEAVVYLDYAATTPMREEVLEAMLPYMTKEFGNPSSAYLIGRNAKAAVAAMKDGDVVLLQNTRYRKEETKNGEEFSAELGSLPCEYICFHKSVRFLPFGSVSGKANFCLTSLLYIYAKIMLFSGSSYRVAIILSYIM